MQDEINQKIAKRLSQLIKSSDLKISALADTACISVSNLYSILRGETTPTLYTLYMLCRGLQISLSRFFIGLEVEEGSLAALDDMQTEERLKELSPRNYKIITEMIDVLLKYP